MKIQAETTSTINNDTFLVRKFNIEIDEERLSTIKIVEGNFSAHENILNLGISEGWLTILSIQDQPTVICE